jgi:hypothetical protein
MSQTILGGDVTIHFGSENRQARLEWTGAATDTRKWNEVYSALQDLFDETSQLDDGIPLRAVTPVAYRIGRIDPQGEFAWFVDPISVEHFYEGALETVDWTRVEGSNNGIVRVTRQTSTNIVPGDSGLDITHADGDSGTLLGIVGDYLYIRPDSNAASNSFDSTTGGNLTCNGHVDPQLTGQGSETGEWLWANAYTLGASLDTDDITYLYVEQDGAVLTSADGGGDQWWPDGHFDICVLVKEVGVEIDEAVIVGYQRRYQTVYSYFELDLSAGGRNPIPLSTGADINILEGPYELVLSGASGTWVAGEAVYTGASWAAATKKGILTQGGTGATPTLQYYLIGDLTQFVDTETLDSRLTAATGTINGVPGNNADGPIAGVTGVTVTHGHDATFDINNDGTTEDYSFVIDCNNNPVQEVYQHLQYNTRRGETGTTLTDGVQGQFYRGIDIKITYTTLLGTVSEGDVVTQVTSGATGTVVAHDLANKVVTLRNSRGTFNTSDDIEETPATNELQGPHTIEAISPNAGAPFGTFAGGAWFLAFGGVLDNVPAADANNYTAYANDGNFYAEPTQVTITVGNTRALDRIGVWELTAAGGTIKRNQYTVDATQGASPQISIKVDPAIGQLRPSSGHVVWYDDSAGIEYVYRYTSYATDVFTLFTQASTTMDATSGETTIVDAGAFGSVLVGDLVYNSTRTAYAYITEVTDVNTIQLDRAITGQTSGDSYEIGTTRSDYDANDLIYVPYLLVHETTGTAGSPGEESVNVVYSTDVPVLARARQAGDIQPWEGEGTLGSGGFSVNIARILDEIYT